MADGDRVYQIDPVVETHLNAELRDRRIVQFEQDKVAAVKVPGQDGKTMEFNRQGDKWVYMTDPYVQIDPAKVKQYLTSLRDAKAVKVIADNAGNLADYGLNKPLCRAQITLDNGKTLDVAIAKGPTPASTWRWSQVRHGPWS